jgi:hypothetical protein
VVLALQVPPFPAQVAVYLFLMQLFLTEPRGELLQAVVEAVGVITQLLVLLAALVAVLHNLQLLVLVFQVKATLAVLVQQAHNMAQGVVVVLELLD